MADRTYAALTMAHEETDALRLWHKYYAAEFGAENLYVVDHNSTQAPARSVLGEGCNILTMPVANPVVDRLGEGRRFDHARFKFLTHVVAALLQYYDCVILGDADEVIVVDPNVAGSLKSYLDGLERVGVRCAVGVDVIHDFRTEPDYDAGQPLFAQRSHFRYNLHFTKPRILSEAVEVTGHGAMAPLEIDPNLLLVHLHWMDWKQKIERQSIRLANFESGRGGQRSYWKDDLFDTEKHFDRFLGFDRSDEDMPHHAFLEDLLPGYRERPLSRDNYQRLSGKRVRLIELVKFIGEADQARIQMQLYQFPDRFRALKTP